jgi:hypothetical protein
MTWRSCGPRLRKPKVKPMKVADDVRVSAARRLLATPRQPDAMSADALRCLLAKWQRHVTRLVAAVADQPAASAVLPGGTPGLARDDLMTALMLFAMRPGTAACGWLAARYARPAVRADGMPPPQRPPATGHWPVPWAMTGERRAT